MEHFIIQPGKQHIKGSGKWIIFMAKAKSIMISQEDFKENMTLKNVRLQIKFGFNIMEIFLMIGDKEKEF